MLLPTRKPHVVTAFLFLTFFSVDALIPLGAIQRLSIIQPPPTSTSSLNMIPLDTNLAATLLSPETVLEPLNPSTEPWLRSIVWTDFRLAVTLFVVSPLILLGLSVAFCRPRGDVSRIPSAEVVLRYLTSYWQASSLLLITVALNIQESTLGVFTGLMAQIMIVVSLWWWSDLNDEIDDYGFVDAGESSGTSSSLLTIFVVWRKAATIAAVGGVLLQIPFQGCVTVSSSLASNPMCAPWLEPPMFAAGLIGLEKTSSLALAANGCCALYFTVLVYYLVILLPLVGRRGLMARPKLMDLASPIGVWRMLGFIGDPQQQQQEQTTDDDSKLG